MPVSQNGYSANDWSLMRAALVAGTDVTVFVRQGAAGGLLAYVAARWNREVEPLRAADGVLDCWGYSPRLIRGSTTTISNHASGTAVDLRARSHPLGRTGTFRPAQVVAIRRILDDCRHAVRWGGDYSGRKDEMHVEIVVDEATCRGVLDKLNPTLEEDDMPTADDIAAAVWRYNIRNGFGDTVQAQQILVGGERRIADAQQALAQLTGQVAALHSTGVDPAVIKQAVLDALAVHA
jgi:D-alanyl-D-alanine carboxypeptidase